VTEARTWVGTPFKHQGRTKGVGVDCLGIVLGVAEELDIVRLTDREMKLLSRYKRIPNALEIIKRLKGRVIKKGTLEVGAIVHLSWGRGMAYHAGIITSLDDGIMAVHARGYPTAEVVEEILPSSMDIIGYYRFKA
jgi:cell wall-associated NlpC family hydrolase